MVNETNSLGAYGTHIFYQKQKIWINIVATRANKTTYNTYFEVFAMQ